MRTLSILFGSDIFERCSISRQNFSKKYRNTNKYSSWWAIRNDKKRTKFVSYLLYCYYYIPARWRRIRRELQYIIRAHTSYCLLLFIIFTQSLTQIEFLYLYKLLKVRAAAATAVTFHTLVYLRRRSSFNISLAHFINFNRSAVEI